MYADQKPAVPLTVRFNPIEKEQLRHIAEAEGVSVSQAVRLFALRGMQARIDMQYASFLEPVIERVINKHLNNRDARIISLLVRIAFDSGQTRSIVTNILGLQPDITPDLLRDIIQESDKHAKSNIMKRTPQITEMIEALEKWFFQQIKKEGNEVANH